VENRQKVGYDAGLPGCGLLIWHIAESAPSSNAANADDTHRLADLEEADGRNDLDNRINKGDAGDPYPGSAANRAFTVSSYPNSRLYNGTDSGVSVTSIGDCASTMSASITAPGTGAPTATPTRTTTRTSTVTPSRTATRTSTATLTGPTRTATRTMTRIPGSGWTIRLPIIVSSYPPTPPTPTRTATATPTATTTPDPSGWVTIVREDFEGAFPGPWNVGRNAGHPDYYWAKRSCLAYQGSYSGWAVGGGASGASLACGSSYPDNVNAYMTYGPFSLVGATAANMILKLWANTESTYDRFCPMASIDGTNFYGYCGSGNSSGWIDSGIDLSSVYTLGNLLGRANVWVGLFFSSDASVHYTAGIYADNIVVRKCLSGACTGGAPLSVIPSPTGTLHTIRLDAGP
jgi:hypothetical protein